MAKISSRLINIDNSKFISKPRFNSKKVSKIKYPRCSISCSLQLEGGNSISPTTTILLKRCVSEKSSSESKLSFLTYPKNSDNVSKENTDIIDVVDLSFMDDYNTFEICGHSHGIVCLYYHGLYEDIFLCNPVTMEFRRLPPSIFNLTYYDPALLHASITGIGFGYDPKSKDLKVVRMVNIFGSRRVEVYNLSTDRWREIKTPMFEVDREYSQLYHNGVYYWSGVKHTGDDDYEQVILSFDMSEEVFQLIPMPRNYDMDCASAISLLVWNGSIVTTTNNVKDIESGFWAMENNDGRVSWSMLLTVNNEHIPGNPLLLLNSYELLWADLNHHHLVIFNFKTQKVKLLKDVKGNGYRMQAFVFEKSLLSVKGGTSLVTS